MDIKNKNIEQLKKYVQWEKDHFSEDAHRMHVLDWAVQEIEALRKEVNRLTSFAKKQ